MIPKLEVSGVSYSYHSLDGETLALSDISFTVDTGEFLAIVGPSGCGKSTLLTMLCGLTTPYPGRLRHRLHASEGPPVRMAHHIFQRITGP